MVLSPACPPPPALLVPCFLTALPLEFTPWLSTLPGAHLLHSRLASSPRWASSSSPRQGKSFKTSPALSLNTGSGLDNTQEELTGTRVFLSCCKNSVYYRVKRVISQLFVIKGVMITSLFKLFSFLAPIWCVIQFSGLVACYNLQKCKTKQKSDHNLWIVYVASRMQNLNKWNKIFAPHSLFKLRSIVY